MLCHDVWLVQHLTFTLWAVWDWMGTVLSDSQANITTTQILLLWFALRQDNAGKANTSNCLSSSQSKVMYPAVSMQCLQNSDGIFKSLVWCYLASCITNGHHTSWYQNWYLFPGHYINTIKNNDVLLWQSWHYIFKRMKQHIYWKDKKIIVTLKMMAFCYATAIVRDYFQWKMPNEQSGWKMNLLILFLLAICNSEYQIYLLKCGFICLVRFIYQDVWLRPELPKLGPMS